MDCRSHPSVGIAARALVNGGVIAYPTEAVWGLGADPFNLNAVEQVLALKGRAPEKGLILVASNIEQFNFILHNLTTSQQMTLLSSWPGATTWLVPHFNQVPSWICGCHDTVALRVSAHPIVKALCETVGAAIVSTSANPQGLMPAKYGYRVRQYFSNAVEYVTGQVDLNARPSEIRDLVTGRIVRS